jgi:hypothetical protein
MIIETLTQELKKYTLCIGGGLRDGEHHMLRRESLRTGDLRAWTPEDITGAGSQNFKSTFLNWRKSSGHWVAPLPPS